MTKRMDEVMEKVRALPDDTQDEIARLLRAIVEEEDAADDLAPEQEDLLRQRLAEADRQEFATAEEVARLDASEIYEFITARSPRGARRVGADIEAVVELARLFPRSGRKQKTFNVRRLVSRKYRYVVTYRVDIAQDQIVILLVEHPRQNRKYQNQ
jgi:toxin ParE1/3/4